MKKDKLYFYGIRPSGRMHFGHYLSMIVHPIDIVLIADINSYQSETYSDSILEDTFYTVKTILPNATILIQSDFKNELLYERLEMEKYVSFTEIMNKIPSVTSNMKLSDFLYPMLMAADIAVFTSIKENDNISVVVGSDQNINLEVINKILKRKFNKQVNILNTNVIKNLKYPLLKMSSSCSEEEEKGVLWLGEDSDSSYFKIKKAYTDLDKLSNSLDFPENLVPDGNIETSVISGNFFTELRETFPGDFHPNIYQYGLNLHPGVKLTGIEAMCMLFAIKIDENNWFEVKIRLAEEVKKFNNLFKQEYEKNKIRYQQFFKNRKEKEKH